MRPRAIVIVGIAGYLVFLVATMPARWALAHAALPPGLALSAVAGTVWNGSARVATNPGSEDLAEVRWHFLPGRLVSARLAYEVVATGPAIDARGEVARGFGTVEARNVVARGDAAHLSALTPLLAAWRPNGAVTLEMPALAWDGRELRGQARAQWRDASLAISDVRPLGSYAVQARAEGGAARFDLTTSQGPLRIVGRGTFSPPGALVFSGEARADATASAALEPLLALLGPRRADGARALEWRNAAPPNPSHS